MLGAGLLLSVTSQSSALIVQQTFVRFDATPLIITGDEDSDSASINNVVVDPIASTILATIDGGVAGYSASG